MDITTEVLTIDEAAAYLKLHRVTVSKLATAGKIPSVKVGKSRRFLRKKLEEFLSKPAPAYVPRKRLSVAK